MDISNKIKYFLLTAAVVMLAAVSCFHDNKHEINEYSVVKVDETKNVLKLIKSYSVIKNLYAINDSLLLIIGNGERCFYVYNYINGTMRKKIGFDESFVKKLYSNLEKKFSDSLKLFDYEKVKKRMGGKTFSFPYYNDISYSNSHFFIRGILYYGLHIFNNIGLFNNVDLFTVYEYLLKFNIKTFELENIYPAFFYLKRNGKKFYKINETSFFHIPSFHKTTTPFIEKDTSFYFFTHCDTNFSKSFDTLPHFVKINFNNGDYEFLKIKINQNECMHSVGLQRFRCIEQSQFSKNNISNNIYVFNKNIIYNLLNGDTIYNITNSKNDIIYNFFVSDDENKLNTLFYSLKGFYYKTYYDGKLTDSLFVGSRDSVYGVDMYKNTGIAIVRKGENFYFKIYKFE